MSTFARKIRFLGLAVGSLLGVALWGGHVSAEEGDVVAMYEIAWTCQQRCEAEVLAATTVFALRKDGDAMLLSEGNKKLAFAGVAGVLDGCLRVGVKVRREFWVATLCKREGDELVGKFESRDRLANELPESAKRIWKFRGVRFH